MIKYRYYLENVMIETLELSEVPKGMLYETYEVEEKEEIPIEKEPTKKELLQTVQSLEEQLKEVKQQLNNLK
jgi:hypothetical protein